VLLGARWALFAVSVDVVAVAGDVRRLGVGFAGAWYGLVGFSEFSFSMSETTLKKDSEIINNK